MSTTNGSNHISRLPDSIVNALVALGMAVGIGFGAGVYKSITDSPSVAAITEAQYERIEPGMTLTDVRAIAGDGVEVRRSEYSAIFEWSSVDGRTVTGTFEGDRLVEKAQSTRRQ